VSDTHAVVIGGSLAGLSAARSLSDHFARVTLIDRDAGVVEALERPGVAQGRHVHALLARGRQELERLFPGFDRLMLERGALDLDFGLSFAALRASGWQPREGAGLTALFASRMLLESVVHELFRTLPNVTLLERTDVTGLVPTRNGQLGVAGVCTRARDGGGARELAADLVVDASGRTSRAPEWLRALGLEPPSESVVDSFCGYSTRWYQAPDPRHWPREWWWEGIWIDPLEPEHMMAGVLFPVEGRRWIVTIAGLARHYPPADEAGFVAALEGLRSPILAQAVRLAEPISPIYCNRAMANRFRHYERWGTQVTGFLATGDAACAFNPVYGQGMSCAAVCARILDDCLRRVGPTSADLPRVFFAEQARFLGDAWNLATGADFRFPETVGERPPLISLMNRYMDEVFAAALEDATVRRTIIEVMHMLQPPSAMFGPAVVGRTALSALRRRLLRTVSASATPAVPAAT
jgi:2-polyprenyl-6-methoxyphenol hydroxylase-like FAD-dependent oxidoreductase